MTRVIRKWIVQLPLLLGCLWMGLSCRLAADPLQKLEESQRKAEHMQDGEAFKSTLMVVVVVVLLGIIASVYFIRKDKTEDKDLEE